MMDDSELISSSDITKNGLDWAMIDNFMGKLREDEAIVVNTDVSHSAGIHWICMMLHDDVVYIVDPLGYKNITQRPYDDKMLQEIKDEGYDVLFYNGKFQFSNSSLCGYFSIAVARELNKLSEVTPDTIYKCVDDMFGTTADVGDVNTLIKMFGLQSANALDTQLD